MATGVPKRRRSEENATGSPPDSLLSLDYPGEASLEDILASQPSSVARVARGSGAKGCESRNRLYFGDNLGILALLLQDRAVAGNVRLVYIDPPFATETVFHSRKLAHAYEDTLSGPEYVEFLRRRLALLRELMSNDGSIYVHLDDKMVFHIKLVMDELFGMRNFRNCITRKKCNPKNYTRKQYGNVSDYILFYTKTEQYVWNKPVEPWTELRAREYQYIDAPTGRRYMKVPVHAPGTRRGETGKPWRGVLPPPGKHWQFPPSVLEGMDARGEIYWSPRGNPRRKVFLDASPGVGVQDIWMEFRDAHNQNVLITGYPTEKNPNLLARIIAASSNPGDLVLDCFSGSGTTLAVADSLERNWIGVDNSAEALRTTLNRFEHGLEPMGDFVSQTETKGKNVQQRLFELPRDENVQQDFFDSPEDGIGMCKPSNAHVPITDYLLYAEQGKVPVAAAVASEYKLNGIPTLK